MVAAHAFLSQPAVAQGLPSTLRGDTGLQAGTQPPPGLYITTIGYNYNFDTLVTNDGRKIEGSGSINQSFVGLAAYYVSEKKILGAHYGASYVLPIISVAIDTPRLDLQSRWSTSDVYFLPIQLGWQFKQADLIAGYGLFVPSGRFSPGASDNTGFGQWSHEFNFGFTAYPNEKKSFNLATLVSYDIQSTKKGGQKVGDVLTLEGGVGVAFKSGLLNTGLAYYTQWKMTEDRIPSSLPAFRGKHRYIGLGPEFNYTWLIKQKTPMTLLFRYFFETENRVATQGNALLIGVTFAVPGKH
ncbi:MAG: transporter [Blastocatellia bacterium]|nr:transporter [Blastocatellia bacterium]